jgi:hypothetical protein
MMGMMSTGGGGGGGGGGGENPSSNLGKKAVHVKVRFFHREEEL